MGGDGVATDAEESTSRVLIVEDEAELATIYRDWLDDRYDVTVANTGQAALERVDETLDVALLDRRIPDLSGDAVLERIRESDADPRAAMITAVEPDFDILEMGFDDYLVKPVFREELRDLVDSLLERAAYDERVQRYYALASKRAVLEEHKSRRELASNDRYARLTDELLELGDELDATTTEMERADFDAAFRKL